MRDTHPKRDLIKTQALRLFAERGIDTVSVRDIAEACDMKAPNLYAHFDSRDALLAELFAEGYAAYGAILAEAADTEGPLRRRLDAMVRAICRLHDEDTIRFRFLILTQHAFLATTPNGDQNPVEVVCRSVAAAMDSGEIPRREPDLMAMAVIGLIVQPATAHLYGRLPGGLLPRIDEIVAMCWRVLT